MSFCGRQRVALHASLLKICVNSSAHSNHILYHCPNKTGQSQMLRLCEETDRKWWASAEELKGPQFAAAYHVCSVESKLSMTWK